jgi:hypothetical protein
VVLGIDFAGRTHQQTTSPKRRQWRVLVVPGVVSAVKMGFVIVSSCILLLLADVGLMMHMIMLL